MAKPKELKVTLVKSRFGRLKSHKACVVQDWDCGRSARPSRCWIRPRIAE